MFSSLLGWTKASKCLKLVKLLRSRLKLLKSKRYSTVRQSRYDIAQLLKKGQNYSALGRIEQLFKDQSLLDAYDLLDHFCELIIIQFSYIRKHKDCPRDVNEAVSTLIFASSWCGDLPELQKIKKLFGEYYGHKFTDIAAGLLSGNLVNNEIKEKLCTKSISTDLKLKLINEISRDYCLKLWYIGCRYAESEHNIDVVPFIFEPFRLVPVLELKNRSQVETIHTPEVVCPSETDSSISKAVTTSYQEKIGIPLQFCNLNVCLEEIQELQFNVIEEDKCAEEKRMFLFRACETCRQHQTTITWSQNEKASRGNSVTRFSSSTEQKE